MASRLLSGLRVIELSEVWAGPMGGSLLGDLGADVIKVESYPRASQTRPLTDAGLAVKPGDGPPYERSALHHLSNRNKRNITLNLRHPSGIEPFHRLLKSADVVYDGYSAGTVEGRGWGWDVIREVNPRIVDISMPGWGHDGPYRGYVTLGSGLDASVGHTSVRGYPGDSPEDVRPIFHSDATGALALVTAVLTGLWRRKQTGEGCFIDLSQIEAMAWQLPGIFLDYTLNGRVAEPIGNVDPHIVPHDVYPCAGDDSWVFVAAEDDRQWAGLATALGHDEWAEFGHPWASVTGRLRARAEIDSAITNFTCRHPSSEAADILQSQGVIAAPCVSPAELVASPQLADREWFSLVEHAFAGANLMPGFLWATKPDRREWFRPAGLVGEHIDEVFGELGYSADEVADLEEQGVIGRAYALP